MLGGDVRQLVYISAGKQLIRSCGNTESLGESLPELHPRIAHSFKINKTQVTEVCDNLCDNNSIGAQSHAQVGRIVTGGSGVYVFASRSTSLEEYVCLDSCSSEHVFCDSRLVLDIRKGERQLKLESNGSSLNVSWKKPKLIVKSLGGYWPSFHDEMLVVIWFLEASILHCVGNLVGNFSCYFCFTQALR